MNDVIYGNALGSGVGGLILSLGPLVVVMPAAGHGDGSTAYHEESKSAASNG